MTHFLILPHPKKWKIGTFAHLKYFTWIGLNWTGAMKINFFFIKKLFVWTGEMAQ